MVSGADPVESFLRSVKDAIAPLESGFSRFSRDLESHWCNNNSGGSRNGAGSVDFFAIGLPMKKREASASLAVVTASGERKRGFKLLFGSMSQNSKKKRGENEEGEEEEKRFESCSNCLRFAAGWSLFLNNFVQGFPTPFKSVKKCFGSDAKPKQKHKVKKSSGMNGEISSLELLLCVALDNLVQNLQMFDHMKIVSGMIKGRKDDVHGLLANIKFARVGGAPASLVDAATTGGTVNDHVETCMTTKDKSVDKVESEGGAAQKISTRMTTKDKSVDKVQAEGGTAQKIVGGLLDIPLSNVERLKSTISTVSLMELIESIPQLGGKSSSSKEHPDKKKLFSVQDFFRYTESEGRRFFEELDRDGDGQVTLEDLEIAMRNRKLPMRYARDLMRRTKSNLFSKSIGWKQFLSFMEQKEPTILRAYTTLCLSKSGTLKKNQVLTSLKSAGLPANEDNAAAMMRYLNANTGESISYSHFRNFMLLLPSDRLEDDPRNIWFEAATVVAVPPPVEISAENVLKSALAGGLASALSTSLLHPIDSIKTRVQASSSSFPEVVSKIPQIGVRGLYRGSIPAILGQFSSHGLRTGIFEASKLVLINIAPTLPEIQVQSLASFCSTILGTAVRIPCEVLKQRLQAGIFDNVGEAIVGTMRQDGLRGFFRGTGATLCREVPLYVAGMYLYSESKKTAQSLLNRELEVWETITVGAVSGGLAAVVTTPFDVMKTRMMTAPQGVPVSMQLVAFSILRQDGPFGFFKGAVPRFFWIAPLGAMNFAGYELAKKAMMEKSEYVAGEELQEKRTA